MISLTLIFLFAMSVYTLVVVIVNFVRARRRSPAWSQISPTQDEDFVSTYITMDTGKLHLNVQWNLCNPVLSRYDYLCTQMSVV